MKASAWIFTFGLAAICGAQTPKPQEGLKHTAKPAIKAADASPVTQAEAHEFIGRVQNAVVAVNKIKNPTPTRFTTATTPVTREDVVLEFNRIFAMAKPSFSFKPKEGLVNPKVIKLKNGDAQKAALLLAKWGCVDRVGPLLTSGTDTLTPTQFGDAVGFFVARIAELTHITSVKYSPYLNDGNPG